MIRLFVAIDIPDLIKPFVANLGGTIHGGRPVPEDQLHITLKFIGEVDTAALHDIRDALHSVRHDRFSIRLQGVGHFPPRGMPKVIWAGLEQSGGTVALRNKIEKSLFAIGIERERRKFSPHLTLCRLKNTPLKKVTRFLAEHAPLETPEFEIADFTLYSSILTQKGAVHTVEEIIPLR